MSDEMSNYYEKSYHECCAAIENAVSAARNLCYGATEGERRVARQILLTLAPAFGELEEGQVDCTACGWLLTGPEDSHCPTCGAARGAHQ